MQRGQVTFATGELLFRPLVANTFEPRSGILSQFGKNKLRLDIGNSIDLLRYQPSDGSAVFGMGADFFTYTLLRGEKNFHFPVDASDYFFGINFSARKNIEAGIFSSRLRISHISAHFDDGHYDNTQGLWKDGRPPVVYSREFLDGVVALQPTSLKNNVRLYIGGTYLFHVDPKPLPRFQADAGIEYHLPCFQISNFYWSYQATVLKITETSVRHNVQIGWKLGDWEKRGVDVYLSYFSGYSIHGEYYNVKESYCAAGFLVEI
ncbi:MAG TPA: DUF1207 domain-containing protein [Bacteroidota bacterium]|nr:DUF1207 domain-containing protein [Bacteroidota bacterium]